MQELIKTNRLLLSKPTVNDLSDLNSLSKSLEFYYDPKSNLTQLMYYPPINLSYWIAIDWMSQNVGYYVARTIDKNQFVGYVGVAYRKFKNNLFLNLAYHIKKEFRKQGLVYEACLKILEDVKLFYPNEVIVIHTKSFNIPSINLAKKLGFIHNNKFDNLVEKNDIYFFNVPINESNKY